MSITDQQVAPPMTRNDRPWLWPVLIGGAGVLTVLASYFSIRYAHDPFYTAVVAVGAAVVGLAVVGYLGVRRGYVAHAVVVALMLPFIFGAVTWYAAINRVSDEIGSAFGTDSSSDSSGSADTGGDMAMGSDEEPPSEQPQEVLALDNGSYTWANGTKMTWEVTTQEPWGSYDDYCGDGSCGISNKDDRRWVFHYEVSAPPDATQPLDGDSCAGELQILNGNSEEVITGVSGDYAHEMGEVRPGATKTGDDEYSIEKSALGQKFYIESTCGDENGEETAYLEGVIK